MMVMPILQTGEVYYINWKTGMKAKDDPRTLADQLNNEIYSEDESSYDSEESSSESSPTSSRNQQYHHHVEQKDHVLVVAGCKSCLMYFMVPKQVGVCPKCCGQLLHFHRSETGSPWSIQITHVTHIASCSSVLILFLFIYYFFGWNLNLFLHLFIHVLW